MAAMHALAPIFWCSLTAVHDAPAAGTCVAFSAGGERPRSLTSAANSVRRSRDCGAWGAELAWCRRIAGSTVARAHGPFRKFGLRVTGQGRYSIALLQRSVPLVHVGLRLGTICGARRRRKD